MPTRTCPICNKNHDTLLQNRQTGEVVSRFDTCYMCLMDGYTFSPYLPQIEIEAKDPSEQTLADQMAVMINQMSRDNYFYDANFGILVETKDDPEIMLLTYQKNVDMP